MRVVAIFASVALSVTALALHSHLNRGGGEKAPGLFSPSAAVAAFVLAFDILALH